MLSSPSPFPDRAGRDPAIDLVRALCVVGVVTLHALMVGVTVDHGSPVFENAGESGWWLIPTSWALQVMPLFFIIGGFAGITSLRRSGANPVRFAATRVHRLLRPAIPVVAVVGALLALLTLCGVSDELIHIAGFRFGQPLWFLGVFLLCQVLLPSLAHLHDRHPLATVSALATAAVLVDIARGATGIEAVGFVNLVFVWLTLQQAGFFLADGRIDALPRRVRLVIAASAAALLLVSFLSGIHSPDLIENINPPTTALLLVGAAHAALFSLLRPRVTAFADRPRISAFTAFISQRAMTVYLWHMPVLLGMAGALALMAMTLQTELPALAGAHWWLSRPLWLAIAFAVTAALSLPLARIETARPRVPLTTRSQVAGAVTAGLGGVVLLLVAGTSPFTVAIAVVLWIVALRAVSAERALFAPAAVSPAPMPVRG